MNVMKFVLTLSSLYILPACTDSGKSDIENEEIAPSVNEVPTLTVLNPTDGEVLLSDSLVNVSLQVQDAEDSPFDLRLSMTSDIDAEIAADWQIDESGLAVTSVQLIEGLHQLTFVVEDTAGAVAESSISVEILQPNEPPSCMISAPVSDQWWEIGATASFVGTVSDVEHTPSQLFVEWIGPNGVLGESTPDTDGTVLFDLELSDVGEQTISMQVSDPDGGFCSVDVLLKVGVPPVLTLRSPELSDVVTIDEIVNLWVDVADFDAVGQLLETTVHWESDLDGLIYEGQTEEGSSLYSLSTLSPGVHTLTVTATDSETLTDMETLELRVNRLPSILSLSLSPDPVYTTDDLIATAVLSDPDMDSLNVIYEWYENGQLTGVTGDTVSSTDIHSGDTWRVVVTPNDGYANGVSQEVSVMVSNTPPTISHVFVSPTGSIYNDQVVTCTSIATDPDQTVYPVYEWIVDGTQYISSAIDLSTTVAIPGSNVTCHVSVTDDDGVTVQDSSGFVVSNRAPTVSNVSIDVLSPTTNDTVTCSANASDPDNESVVVDYLWQVGGSTLATGVSVDLSTVSISPTDVLACVVSAEDALGESTSDSVAVTVQNSAPVLTDVALTPVSPTAVDTLTCTATGSDPDGESLIPTLEFQYQGSTMYSTSAWTANFTPSQYGLGTGDTISCLSILTDGYGGSVQLSDSVSLASSAPVLSNISISPSTVYTNTNVSCSANAMDPNDGDLTSGIQYQWMVGNSVIATGATYMVSSGQTNVNDTLMCSATVVDSHGEIDTDSTSVLIQNTVPIVSSVSFSPSSVNNDDVVTCTGTASDPDDTPTLSYAWQASGTPLGSTDTLDLATTSLQPNDVVECVVTASDTYGSSDTGTASITVSNRAPNIPVVNITWSGNGGTAIAGNPLTCTATASDPDGQSLVYTYSWNSTSGSSAAGQTISNQVQGGETWTCTAVASDGQLTSSASTSVNVLQPCSPDTDYTTLNLGGSNDAEFVRVCAGSDSLGRYSISKDLLMMTTEVTQGMFVDLMGYDPTTYGFQYGFGVDHPVYYVNWHMAADFANQLTQRHNLVEGTNLSDCYTCSNSLTDSVSCSMNSACTGYRMPTEAEWEYTARAGSNEEFWTQDGGGSPNSSACFSPITIADGGASPTLDTFAWYCYNRYDSTYYNSDKPVGLKSPNGFGVHDMHGNISEWTTDKWGCTYPVTNVDPLCIFSGTSYTIRGGDWTGNASKIRSSIRNDLDGSTRTYKQGFRVAKEL